VTERSARSSNLELLRILCMGFIIADHLIGQSGIADYSTLWGCFWASFFGCGSRIGCSIFVLVGSWFLCEKTSRTSRPLSLWIGLWLYTVPITALCVATGVGGGLSTLRWAIFPAFTQQLWFVSQYLLLLCAKPLLDKLLQNLSRAAHRAILAGLAVPLVVYPTVFANPGPLADLTWMFLYEYLLAAYLCRYPDNRLAGLLHKPVLALCIGAGLPLLNTALRAALQWQGIGDGKLVQYAEYYRTAMGAAPNRLAALALFYFFKDRKLGSILWINAIASTTLGVYILHQIPAFWAFLWNGIFQCQAHRGSLGYALFVIAAVFAGASLIDALRTKFVMRPLQNSRIFRAICQKGDKILSGD